MDCRSASDADRVCDCGDGVQCPKERKPTCFMDLDPRTEILANSIDVRECFYLNATADSTTSLPCDASSRRLIDYHVSAAEQRRGNRKTEHPGGLHIDH